MIYQYSQSIQYQLATADLQYGVTVLSYQFQPPYVNLFRLLHTWYTFSFSCKWLRPVRYSVRYSNISPICVYQIYLNSAKLLLHMHEPVPMMTSSNGNIFRVTGPLCGEFTGPGEFPTQRPVTRSFDVFFDLLLNKRLSKQPWGWWFETLSWSLWRHRIAYDSCITSQTGVLIARTKV